MRGQSTEALRRLAARLLAKGNLREAAEVLLKASDRARELHHSELADQLRFDSVFFSALAELAHSLMTGNFASVLKESRKLKGISENDDQKRIAQYLESLASIWKSLVEGRTQDAVASMARLDNNLKVSPIAEADFARLFLSYANWARWDVKQAQALAAYGRGDLVEYEKCVGETRRISDSIRAEVKGPWVDNFVDAYVRQNEGLLPLTEGMKAWFGLDFDKALLNFGKASEKFGAAVKSFELAGRQIPRSKLFETATQGYRMLADTLYDMTRGDTQLFMGQPVSARNYYARAVKTADIGIPLLSSVGFLGATMLAYLVQSKEIATRRRDALKDGTAKKETKGSAMTVEPIFAGRSSLVEDDLCFVLAPIDRPFTRLFKNDLKSALRRAGFRALRADNLFAPRKAIIEDIWEYINKARLIVADVTGKNPNVFYELGVAHTVGKDVVVITQRKDDVPFDLRHLRYITYSDTKEGRKSLRESLEQASRRVSRRVKGVRRSLN